MTLDVKQNTSLGQHFMVDESLLDEIILVSELQGNDSILEIGSGNGVLSTRLRKLTQNLITVEIDERFEADIHGNILDTIDTLSFDVLISNLPYHISEPLFVKLSFLRPQKIVVVVGDTFAQVLLGETILGSVMRSIYDILFIRSIPPSAFNPPPRVESALVVCTLKTSSGPLADFFAYPKSKVKNYMKTKTTKRQAQEFINQLPLLLQEKRLYELNTEEFLTLKKIIELMN